MRRAQPGFAERQRGVALIMAVLIVALATILAVNVTFRGMMDQRRSSNLFALDQGFEVALGAEGWAADILRQDAQDSQTDHFGEIWAKSLAALPIDEGVGTVEGRLEDMQGRFNLNNLVFADGTTNEKAVKQLERILAMLDIEPTWAAAMADWIDADVQPGFPDGAEDTVYLGLDPPHLAANMPITRASELMVLPEFGAERFRRLQPYVTALPVGTKLNVCTAPGIVLDSLSETQRQFSLNPEDLAQRRKDICFPSLEDLRGTLGQADYDLIKDTLSESSTYFRATVWVTIGTTQFTLYSLLARGGGGTVRPVLRSFGAE
ncbi:MAG: type II secretion system minor pseudopilin GspK [Gammaproteobacteria bacterium]|nr:type II secretion system minor pseudopilin GspK [Gammaproteobacteria bacterium]MDH5176194.1 type II secretion system minor pseudopilin GspK [Gammaproteobacteria bacterium]